MVTDCRYTDKYSTKYSNIFLTGDINVGKTTVLRKVINRTDGFYGGYLGYSTVENGHKYIRINSLYNIAEDYLIADVDCDKGKPDFVNRNIFEEVLAYQIEKALNSRDILIFDEIGVFEESCVKFRKAVTSSLDSDKLVLGVLKKRKGEFIDEIKSRDDVLVIDVTEQNREGLPLEILEILDRNGYKVEFHSYFSWDTFRIDMYDKCIGREECDYPDIFMKKIEKQVGNIKNKTVLDIGSGTGAFFVEMRNEGACCTGIDISIDMLEKLSSKIERISNDRKKINGQVLLTSFERFDDCEFDIIVSAFSAGINKNIELVEKAYEMANENIFIIYHHPDDKEKFSAVELSKYLGRDVRKEKEKRVINTLLKELSERGYRYQAEEVLFDFPQYIDDIEEGIKLFKAYFDIDDLEIDRLREFIELKAVQISDGFMIPEKRRSIFLNIEK